MALGPRNDKSGDGIAPAAARRGKGFHSPAVTARKRLRDAAAGHGFAEPEVLLRWAEVVGERLARVCTPVKVSYSRSQDLGATLLVRAAGARAIEVEHLGPRILERVNQFYGYRAVHRLKITQTTGHAGATGFAEPPPPALTGPDAAPRTPTPGAEARAADLTRGIENPELRAALTRMAAHILSRDDTPASPRTEPGSQDCQKSQDR